MLTNDQKLKFDDDGYLHIPGFISEADCDSLKSACAQIIAEMDPYNESKVTFASVNEAENGRSYMTDDYFLNSGDKIRFFYEPGVFDDHGNLKYSVSASLNKIGHALHWLNPEFKKVTFSDKVKAIISSLGMIHPAIIHSMYIFKNPKLGSEVKPHQDGTFLHCEPNHKVIGLWIALEDAHFENGCLWFLPKSHKEPIHQRFVRHTDDKGKVTMKTVGSEVKYDNNQFVPVPAKKGDLVIIHGNVVHKSAPNTSVFPRPIYTFHILDQHESEFSELNWIQPTENLPFTPLF